MWIRFHVECTFTELVRQEWGGGIFLPVCSLLTGVLRGLSSCSCSPALGLGWECTVCMVVSKPCVSDVFLAVVLSLDGYFGSILRVALELQSWASSFHWFGKHLVLCMKSLSATRSRPRLLFPVLKRDWHTLNQNRFSPSQQPRWVVKGWSLLIRDMWFCRVGPSGCPTSTLPHRGGEGRAWWVLGLRGAHVLSHALLARISYMVLTSCKEGWEMRPLSEKLPTHLQLWSSIFQRKWGERWKVVSAEPFLHFVFCWVSDSPCAAAAWSAQNHSSSSQSPENRMLPLELLL